MKGLFIFMGIAQSELNKFGLEQYAEPNTDSCCYWKWNGRSSLPGADG